jgi:hypothetical protein
MDILANQNRQSGGRDILAGKVAKRPLTRIDENGNPISNMVNKIGNAGGEIGVGMIKGVASTLSGISKLGERILPGNIKNVLDIKPGVAERVIPSSFTKPQGTSQNVGFMAEQIAEFLAPSSWIAKGEKAVSGVIKGSKLLQDSPKIAGAISTASRSVIEAGAVGGQRLAQTGGNTEEAKTAAIVAGLFPVVGKIAMAGFKKTGERIMQSSIKPTMKDFEDGFKISNIARYNVGGTLQEIETKTHVQLNKLTQQLNKSLKNSNTAINLNDVYDSVFSNLIRNKSKNFGEAQATKRVLDNLKIEIEEVAGKNGLVDLVEATNIKRGAGTKGAWSFGRVEPDSNATEKIYNIFYNKLKIAIEKAEPTNSVKMINKQISELIPISNAVIRRIPVDQRNNILGLTDSIGLFSAVFDPKALALIGGKKLLSSSRFGSYLANIAQKAKTGNSVNRRILGQ